MNKLYMPREFTAEQASVGKEVQVARKELNATDVCPICTQTMRIMSVNGHNAFCCLPDRVVLPIT